jgi:hypothetical protein
LENKSNENANLTESHNKQKDWKSWWCFYVIYDF